MFFCRKNSRSTSGSHLVLMRRDSTFPECELHESKTRETRENGKTGRQWTERTKDSISRVRCCIQRFPYGLQTGRLAVGDALPIVFSFLESVVEGVTCHWIFVDYVDPVDSAYSVYLKQETAANRMGGSVQHRSVIGIEPFEYRRRVCSSDRHFGCVDCPPTRRFFKQVGTIESKCWLFDNESGKA
jgi:hypothetical protein